MPSGKHSATALAATFVAAPVSAWYAIGPLTAIAPPPEGADYVVQPPPIPAWAEHTAGILALALLAGSAVLLYRRTTARLPAWLAFGLFVVGGLIIGGTARLVTAPAVGANIGAGIAIIFGLPTAGVMLVAGVVLGVVAVVRQRRA
ncbi:hypothetical protein [Saccharopolyspora taberi]|uniref:Uncharacterized protein n=1 Tax=Saccharopolyspora taberi TaxID=60895 RepID=A0ABN3V371_9PSEU